MSDEDFFAMMKKASELPPTLRRPKKIVIPRRDPSLVIPPPKIVYVTADKVTCVACPCFPKEDPYKKPKKLLACQQMPRTLYELAAEVLDRIPYPKAFEWSEEQVADWMTDVVGLPQYRECILDNHIDGMRLPMLEDPSHLPEINVHYFDHIQMITAKVREEYTVDFVRFLRSVGLSPRRPLVHCTWFKSRTGPSWGIRKNWTRHQKPEFPKVLIARVPRPVREIDRTPKYKPFKRPSNEFLVPRKFIIQHDLPKDRQFIWVKRPPALKVLLGDDEADKKRKRRKVKKVTEFIIKADSRLIPEKVSTEGLRGRDLILARRKMPKQKFLP